MSVIALPNIAPKGPAASIEWDQRSNTARFPSPLTGYTRTLERYGSILAAKVRYENLNTGEAARMRSSLKTCRGQAQRFYLRDYGYTQRGSFPAIELWPNTSFTSTTGLSVSSETALATSDNLARATRTAVTANQRALSASSVLTVTQYAPYAARFIAHQGRGAYAAGLTVYDSTSGLRIGTTVTAFGRVDGMVVPTGTTVDPALLDECASGVVAGDYLSISFASFARCALVDNGPNYLLRSDEFDNAAWPKSAASATANAARSPDGTTIAESLIEDSSTAFHYASQSATVTSAAADFTFGVAIKAGARTFAWIEMSDGTHNVFVYVNLSTGALGTPTSGGANFINQRAATRNLGDGWWAVYLTGRKTSSSTTVASRVGLATALGTGSYTGNGTSNILVWRGTLAQSSFPTRLRQTTTTAAASGTLQTGGALYLKGLPASTDGLLLQDDQAEIITPSGSQYASTSKALNSDASQLGYWEFEAPLRESPADNAAVIICTPLMRAMLDDRSASWTQRHAGFTDLEFTAVEDITA